MTLLFKEHPSWESVLRRRAESESRTNVETFLPFEKKANHRVMGVGGRQPLTTKTMSNTSQLSLANRKQLADLLTDKYESLRSKIKQKWDAKHDALYETFVRDHAEKKSALPVLKQIDDAQRKWNQLTLELKQLGFELRDDGSLRLCYEDTNPTDKVIESRIEKEIGSRRDIDARFDSAHLAMMTVETLQDAQKLLKSVQEV